MNVVLAQHLPGGTEVNHNSFILRQDTQLSNPVEIRNGMYGMVAVVLIFTILLSASGLLYL